MKVAILLSVSNRSTRVSVQVTWVAPAFVSAVKVQ